MTKTSVNCGDWGQSWGLGTQTIGKLSTEDNNQFTWKGHSQGRHGNKWGKGAKFVFTIDKDDNIVEVERKGSIPNRKALLEGIKEIKAKIAYKAERKAIKQNKQPKPKFTGEGQTTLF